MNDPIFCWPIFFLLVSMGALLPAKTSAGDHYHGLLQNAKPGDAKGFAAALLIVGLIMDATFTLALCNLLHHVTPGWWHIFYIPIPL